MSFVFFRWSITPYFLCFSLWVPVWLPSVRSNSNAEKKSRGCPSRTAAAPGVWVGMRWARKVFVKKVLHVPILSCWAPHNWRNVSLGFARLKVGRGDFFFGGKVSRLGWWVWLEGKGPGVGWFLGLTWDVLQEVWDALQEVCHFYSQRFHNQKTFQKELLGWSLLDGNAHFPYMTRVSASPWAHGVNLHQNAFREILTLIFFWVGRSFTQLGSDWWGNDLF